MTAEADVLDPEDLDDAVVDALLRRAQLAPAVETVPGGIKQPKRRAFLAAYAKTGNISEAARIVGINRNSHYEWLADEKYAEVFAQAHEIAIDYLEAVARMRATEGWLKPVYQGGKLVGHVREFSDTLLIFLLKGARPDKYSERADIRHSGTGAGGAIKVEGDYALAEQLMGDPSALDLAQALAAALLEQDQPAVEAGPAPIPVDSEDVNDA